jgi:hypothetical protein
MDSPDAVWEGTNERGPGNARERQRNIPGTKALLCALAAMALFASLALVAACGSDGVADSTGGQATEQEGGNAATDQTGTQDGSQAQEPSNPGFVLEDTSTVTVDIADNDEEVDNDDANK